MNQERYFNLLKSRFNNREEILSEIINLKAIQNLPKGTEHFVSDIHGEFNAFQHILRNGSGNIKEKIRVLFKDELSPAEQKELATLIYYPEERLIFLRDSTTYLWYQKTIKQLIKLVKFSSSKYSRSKLRKALPTNLAYIIEELLYQIPDQNDKDDYYEQIISNVMELDLAEPLIIGLSFTIQRLVVDHLHVVGDIYDRGPKPDEIIDTLMDYHSVDIQWGNHDILWMGAAAGSPICLLTIIRISARYNNLDIIEERYGINLRPLLTFAEKYYDDNPAFRPKLPHGEELSAEESLEITKIHQAAAILQFKLEAQLVNRRPDFNMSHRLLLTETNYDTLETFIKGTHYPLTNTCFATIQPDNPNKLSEEEEEVIQRIVSNTIHSDKLKRHTDFLFEKGSMYLVYNDNLLIHGCVPLTKDGDFQSFTLNNQSYKGKELMDLFENALRTAYKDPHTPDDLSTDILWYLWSGEYSSLFGKKEMTTFERYFISDKSTHEEIKNPYYSLREKEETIDMILHEFGLSSEDSHLINGHTPIKAIKGESPVKANGKMIVIDGGFSKPYQQTTGLAGYTLLYNSFGMQLVSHKPFSSIEHVVAEHDDILSIKKVVDKPLKRKMVKDTTVGQKIQEEIDDLEDLLRYINLKK